MFLTFENREPQGTYVATGQRTKEGLIRVIRRAADGSFDGRDFPEMKLSQTAKDEIRQLESMFHFYR